MISIPNICIPRVNKNIGLVEIRNTFEKILGPKCIRNIEFKHMNNYNNKVFIYFQTTEKIYLKTAFYRKSCLKVKANLRRSSITMLNH